MLQRLPLRSRVLVVGVLTVALSAAAGYSLYQQSIDFTETVAAREAAFAAEAASGAVNFLADDLSALLTSAARSPAVVNAEADPDACVARLRQGIADEAGVGLVSNLFVVASDGRPLCQTVPGPLPTTDANGALYRWARPRTAPGKILETSEPFFGALSKRWIVVASLPRSGSRGGVVGASIDLAVLNGLVIASTSQTRAVLVTLADAAGAILARSSEFETAVGQVLPQLASVPSVSGTTTYGAPVELRADGSVAVLQTEPVLAPDREGRDRAWVTRAVGPLPWVVYVGVDIEAATADLPPPAFGVAPLATFAFVAVVVGLLATVSRELGLLVKGVERAPIDGPEAIPVTGPPETSALGRALRRAFDDRLHAEAELSAANLALESRVAERSAELRQKAEDLEAANKELVDANRVKDNFLSVMSHELRTPLSSVLSINEALLAGAYGELGDEPRAALTQSNGAGQHLLTLVNDILDYSRLQAGRLAFAHEAVPVAALIEDATEVIRPLARAKSLSVVAPPVPPGLVIAGDAARLRQLLVNLLANAVKFSPMGQTIGTEARMAPDGRVELVVWDTGIGIPDAQLQTIFQPFRQAHEGLHRRFEGTGLGLALGRAIVEALHGEIFVESAVGLGSRFTVRLPACTDDVQAGVTNQEPGS
ncbi:MAG: ATP-binding protein [Vicinamibacterales bacterium]